MTWNYSPIDHATSMARRDAARPSCVRAGGRRRSRSGDLPPGGGRVPNDTDVMFDRVAPIVASEKYPFRRVS